MYGKGMERSFEHFYFYVTNHFVIFDFLIIKNYSHVIKDFWNRLT